MSQFPTENEAQLFFEKEIWGNKPICNKCQGGNGKAIVMGMKQRNGKVKASPIDNISSKTLHSVIDKNIAKGTTIFTDELRDYKGFKKLSYNNDHSAKEYVNGMLIQTE